MEVNKGRFAEGHPGRPKGSKNKNKEDVYRDLIYDFIEMFKSGNSYVYYHIDKKNKEIMYIGKGKNNRAWEFKKGARNNYWDEYFNKLKPTVKLICTNLSEKEALAIENALIKVHKPVLNICGIQDINQTSIFDI